MIVAVDRGRIGRVRYVRDPRLIWRTAGDRLLVRRVKDLSDRSTSEVTGAAAVVFLALDRPLSADDLAHELALAGAEDPAGLVEPALATLREHDLVVEQPA